MGAACYHGDAGPPPPTCTAAAEHVRALIQPASARANRIRDVFAERCDVDEWSAEVRECVVATRSLDKPRHCKAKLTAEQRAALDLELSALRAAVPAVQLPQTCRDYQALMQKLGSCTVIRPSLRAAFEQGYRELSQEWAPGARINDVPALETRCRTLASTLRHIVGPVCGW